MNHESRHPGTVLLLVLLAAVGCDRKSENDGRGTTLAETRAEARPAVPRHETIVVPAGTAFSATLETPLSTATNHSGDSFVGRTIDAVVIDGRTVVPAGATVHGVLRDVQASGKIKNRAHMTLDFVRVEDARGNAHGITAQPLTLEARSKTGDDVEKIAAGGVLGAIIGGVASGKKGAVIGAGAGAGAGTVIVLATKGHEVELGAGHRLQISTLSDTHIQLAARN